MEMSTLGRTGLKVSRLVVGLVVGLVEIGRHLTLEMSVWSDERSTQAYAYTL
jgi:aryl-alcohol dehydrogenase-like predicted oxidoreductase